MPEIPSLDSVNVRKGPKKQLIDTFNQTNLDTQDNAPEGGPINSPEYNFSQKYSINNPYFVEGTQAQESVLSHSLSVTALDLENSEAGVEQGAEGGPNRTNAENRLGTVGSDGTYTLQNASTSPLSPTPGGVPLKDRDGKDAKQQLNAYTPNSTYMEAIIKYRDEANNELI